MVIQHFEENHYCTKEGQFVVPLPKNPQAKLFGESRPQAVRRFFSLERSLHLKGESEEFNAVMEEYFRMGHAEQVPIIDLNKPVQQVHILPTHAFCQEGIQHSHKDSSGV